MSDVDVVVDVDVDRHVLFRFEQNQVKTKLKINVKINWVVSFTLVTLLRHMCSPSKLFDVDAPWFVQRSTFLLVAFQN